MWFYMDEEKKVSDALRRARIEHGWTQKELADQIGIAEATVRSWERRKRSPNPEFLALFEPGIRQVG